MPEPEVVNVYLGGVSDDPWIFDWGPGRFTVHKGRPPDGKPRVYPAGPSVPRDDDFEPWRQPDIVVVPHGTVPYPGRRQGPPPIYGRVSMDDLPGKLGELAGDDGPLLIHVDAAVGSRHWSTVQPLLEQIQQITGDDSDLYLYTTAADDVGEDA
jgi:hypothetical protein